MSEPRPYNRWLAIAWLLAVVALGAHQVHLWRAGAWDTDMLALLPQDAHAADTAAVRALLQSAAQEVMVVIGGGDWDTARKAAQAFTSTLEARHAPLQAGGLGGRLGDIDAALAVYRPYRNRLLTASQRQMLTARSPLDLGQMALENLYQPAYGPHLTSFAADPLNLWPAWWSERAAETRVRPRDGQLSVHDASGDYVVLPLTATTPTFSLTGGTELTSNLEAATTAARQVDPNVVVLSAGVPLHAEAAAARASWEVNTIGLGSLAAVLILVWCAFRSLWPMALVALSLGVGCAAGLSVTALLFGKVHLVTMVFGASLVGVAEDYGIHYFASRQGHPASERWALLQEHLPGLSLALATSVLGYLALGLAPFPGLRQMAVFSGVGLVAAFATVICWFPWLDRGDIRPTAFCRAIAASLPRWPRLSPRNVGTATLGTVLLLGVGLSRLQANDDVRILQSSPPALMDAQRRVAELLGLVSPAQFFLVSGDTAEAVLEHEEALKAELAPLLGTGRLTGVRSLSDWVPSEARQRADGLLTERREAVVLEVVAQTVHEDLQRPAFATAPLELTSWLQQFGSTVGQGLWLGAVHGTYVSVIQLRGLHDVSVLPELEAAASRCGDNVRWVNKTAEISHLLQRYRGMMGALLIAGYVAVFAALWWRFGKSAWRAMLPTAVASGMAVAILGLIGQPMQLFTVLALLLVLGTGVDYGIFILEDRGDGAAWVAVVIGAASTWLSFGLLALSATPALRVFGLTMLFGIGLVWVLTPCFRPQKEGEQHEA